MSKHLIDSKYQLASSYDYEHASPKLLPETINDEGKDSYGRIVIGCHGVLFESECGHFMLAFKISHLEHNTNLYAKETR